MEGHDARLRARVRGGQDTIRGDVTASHPRQCRAVIVGAEEAHICRVRRGENVTTGIYARSDLIAVVLGRGERNFEQHIAAGHHVQITRVTTSELHIKLFARGAAERYIASIRLEGYVRSCSRCHLDLTATIKVYTAKTVHEEVVGRVGGFVIEVLPYGYSTTERLNSCITFVREFDFSLLIEFHGACTLH